MHGLYILFSQRHLNIFLGNNQSSERNLTSCSLYFSNSICREKISQLLGRHVATEKGGSGSLSLDAMEKMYMISKLILE